MPSRRTHRWREGVVAFQTARGTIQLFHPATRCGVELESLTSDLPPPEGACIDVESLLPHLAPPDPRRPSLAHATLLAEGWLIPGDASEPAETAPALRVAVAGDPAVVTVVERGLSAIGISPAGAAAGVPPAAHRLARSDIIAHVGEILGGPPVDLVLLARAGEDPLLESLVARAVATAGRTLLTLSVAGPRIELGPIMLPGESSCSECKLLRALAGNPASATAEERLRMLARVDEPLGPPDPDALALQLAVAVAAAAVRELADRGRVPTLVNRVLNIITSPLSFTGSRLLRFPGCPTCDVGCRGRVG